MTAIRPAAPADVPQVLGLIRQLAAFERAPDAVRSSEAQLAQALFPAGGAPLVHCFVAERGGAIVGMALWFVSYSTWEGKHGIFLEDLFVAPAARGAGIGRALLASLAAEAERRGFRRVEWSVLDWNTPARDFYGAMGAAALTEWVPYRISGEALAALARGGTGADAAAT